MIFLKNTLSLSLFNDNFLWVSQPSLPSGHRPPDTDGEIQKCSMNEKKSEKMMMFQKIFVTLPLPRKKGLRLALSVVCLAREKGSFCCLSNIGVLV
jgi:hypothetical protein